MSIAEYGSLSYLAFQSAGKERELAEIRTGGEAELKRRNAYLEQGADQSVIDHTNNQLSITVPKYKKVGIVAGAAIGAGIGASVGSLGGPPGIIAGGVGGAVAGGIIGYKIGKTIGLKVGTRKALMTMPVTEGYQQWKDKKIQMLIQPLFKQFLSSEDSHVVTLKEFECSICFQVCWIPMKAPDGNTYDQECITKHLLSSNIVDLESDDIHRSPFRKTFNGDFEVEDLVLDVELTRHMLKVSKRALTALNEQNNLSASERNVLDALSFYHRHVSALTAASLRVGIEAIVQEGVDDGIDPDDIGKRVAELVKNAKS